MTFTPAWSACFSTPAPDGASIESMISTLTPSPIVLCAIEANLLVRTSGVIPAALRPLVSSGASYSVYRVDDVVSGRIAPTLPDAWPGLPDGGACAPLVGGLDRSHAAETPPPLLLLELLLLELLEPQAARPAVLRMSAAPRGARRCRGVDTYFSSTG